MKKIKAFWIIILFILSYANAQVSDVSKYIQSASPERLVLLGMKDVAAIRAQKEEQAFKIGIIYMRPKEFGYSYGNIDEWLWKASSEELALLGYSDASKYRMARELREEIYKQDPSKFVVKYYSSDQ